MACLCLSLKILFCLTTLSFPDNAEMSVTLRTKKLIIRAQLKWLTDQFFNLQNLRLLQGPLDSFLKMYLQF